MDDHKIDSLFRLVVVGPRDIHKIRRWRGPDYANLPDEARDTTLEHTLSIALMIGALLAIEEEHPMGKHKGVLNHERLLLAAIIHDIGEGAVGDLPWRVKRDQRISGPMREIEHEQVNEMLRDLPEAARDLYTNAYRTPHEESLEGRFFDAAHLVGQLALAVIRYRDGHRQFVEAFSNILTALEPAATEFASIELCLAPFREWLAREVERDNRAKALRVLAGEVDPE